MKREMLLSLLAMLLICSCNKKDSIPKSSNKSIDSFILKTVDNPSLLQDITASILNDTILIPVPMGINIRALVPTIGYTGGSLAPSGKVAQDFTNTVVYTVTATDGSTKIYKVLVHYISSSKTITSFTFKQQKNPSLTVDIPGTIIGDSIYVLIPQGTDVTGLIPTIVSTGTSISPRNEQPENFSFPFQYVVTAEDGTTNTYSVFLSANSDVFIHGNDGYLYDVNGSNGTLKWKYNVGGSGVPTYDNGIVFVLGGNNMLYAIYAASGSLKWQKSTPNSINTLPAIKYGKIYFGGFGFVYAANEDTGNQEWLSSLFPGYTITSSIITNPTVGDNIVCAYDIINGMFVFNANDGTPVWYNLNMLGRGNPIILNGVIYYTPEGGISAVDERTGHTLWNYINSLVYSSPTIVNGILYIGAGSHIYARNINGGALQWQYSPVNIPQYYSPVVSNNNLIIASTANWLSSFSITNGSLNWTNPHFSLSPVVANNEIFICDDSNQLNCVDARTGNIKWIFKGYTNISQPACVVDSKMNVYHNGDSGEQN